MAAAPRSKDQLAERVAENLVLLRPGETLNALRRNRIIAAYDEVHAELRDNKIAYWPLDEVPVAVFNTTAYLVAIQIAPTFGAMQVLLASLGAGDADQAVAALKMKLRDHLAKDPHYETMSIDQDYF